MAELIVLTKYFIRGTYRLFFGQRSKPDPSENTQCAVEPACTKQNQWIIDGKVYDLTPFLDSHPGGSHILLMNSGRDCTEMFFMYHMSSRKSIQHFLSMLSRYYVCDATPQQISSPFKWTGKNLDIYTDFKQRVRRHFDDQAKVSDANFNSKSDGGGGSGNRSKASDARMVWYFVLFLAQIVAHLYWVNGYWCAIPVLSMLHWLFSTDLLHNGTHYQLVRNPWLNQALSLFGGLYHVPNIEWEMQHVISHHSYTNMHGLDIDLNHFLNNFRTCLQQGYRQVYAKWRYCIAFYVLLTSVGQIDVWQTKLHQNVHRAMVPFWRNLDSHHYINYVYVAQLLWMFAIVPGAVYYHFGVRHFFKAFLFLLLPRVGHGALYYIFSQASHIHTAALGGNGEGEGEDDGEDELYDESWVIHQIKSCVDYDVNSWVWNIISIGLNNQTMHHLCPSTHPCHYIALQREVLDPFCSDHNVKRRVFPNLYATLLSYFEHLALVNDSQSEKEE